MISEHKGRVRYKVWRRNMTVRFGSFETIAKKPEEKEKIDSIYRILALQ